MNNNDEFALKPQPDDGNNKPESSNKRIQPGILGDVSSPQKSNLAAEEWCRRGEALYYGIEVKRDEAEALKWFRQAANEGLGRAQCWLGYLYQHCYQHERHIKKDLPEGARWFQHAAKQGEAIAQYNLGVCYEGGLGVSVDNDKMILWYRNAAEQGHLESHFRLGVHYTSKPCAGSFGVSGETRDGMTLLQRASEKGHIQSQLRLGRLQGSRSRNYAEQFKWYSLAAQQGNGEGQASLGTCYERGEGAPQDHSAAIKWYQAAIEQGDRHGQYALGSCYENGRGVVRNLKEATKWYHLAAERGHAEAARTLAVCYERGQGVRQNLVEARRWYEEAAEDGDAEAQCRHADFLSKGHSGWGLVEAYKWLRIAAEDFDHQPAEGKLSGLRSSLSPDQIVDGEKRFREFRDRETESRSLGYQQRPFEPENQSAKPTRMGALKIVVMDDERYVGMALRMMLQFDLPNAEIRTFTDVEAALEILEQEDPDLFTTDYAHPKINGHELLRILADRKVKYPIIMLSAYAEVLKPQEWLKEFGNHPLNFSFLPKPFLLEELRQLMTKHLGPEYGRPETLR